MSVGSVINPLSTSTSSVASSAASVTAPQTTTDGTSTFATDLQAAETRAVAIASLPIQLLQADQSTVSGQTSELQTLSGLFGNLQSAVQSLASGTGSGAQSASASDTSVVQPNLSGNALPGTYTIDVLNAGSTSSAISNDTSSPVTDPTSQSISQSTSFTLTVGSNTYTIQPSGQDLNDLASAINSSGAPVQALVLNLGSPSAPSYQLVLQSTSLGDVALQLNDGQNNLLSTLNSGANASYTVNGQPPGGISTSSSTVTIAPGLDVSLENTGTSTVTVSASLNNVSNALSSFVDAYNSVVTELQRNHGQNGGALTGDSTILSMEQALNQIGNYTGSSGSITSLTQLGVEYTQQGTLTFDPTALSNLSQSQINDALTYLGGPTSGGLLEFATNTLNSITDPTNGIIAMETQALNNENQSDQNQINTLQDQVNQLQQNLNIQMAQADALIATLQQQNTFLTGLFQYATSNNPDATSAA